MNQPRPNEACWCGSGRKYKRCHMHKDKLSELQGGRSVGALAARPQVRTVEKGVVSPVRTLPDGIRRPDYAQTGKPATKAPDPIKGPAQIDGMRKACRMAREVLDLVSARVAPGVTTEALDSYAHELCIERQIYPSPLNYFGYPKSICTSVNEVICHGIPDSRPLEDGDIVNVDVTVYVDGFHGDCSQTLLVGDVDAESRKLVATTQECLMEGIAVVKPGALVRDIGRAIERVAGREGYGVVRNFVGHGIGETFHMEPQVPHYYDNASRFEMKAGMTFTIEPMINMGTWRHSTWDDNWTAVTADLMRSAQFEHTVLVTPEGVEILTLPAGEPQPFAH